MYTVMLFASLLQHPWQVIIMCITLVLIKTGKKYKNIIIRTQSPWQNIDLLLSLAIIVGWVVEAEIDIFFFVFIVKWNLVRNRQAKWPRDKFNLSLNSCAYVPQGWLKKKGKKSSFLFYGSYLWCGTSKGGSW